MGLVTKAVGFIVGGATVFYLVLFLAALPAMANAPKSSMIHAMAANVYNALYVPLRDALPRGNFLRELIIDYESYCCAGSSGCVLR